MDIIFNAHLLIRYATSNSYDDILNFKKKNKEYNLPPNSYIPAGTVCTWYTVLMCKNFLLRVLTVLSNNIGLRIECGLYSFYLLFFPNFYLAV